MTTRRPTHCIECSVRLTRANRSSESSIGTDRDDVCNDCYDYWGWENTHQDEEHDKDYDLGDYALLRECRVCLELHPELDPHASSPTGRHNISHAGHDHPATPAGRAACRKAQRRFIP